VIGLLGLALWVPAVSLSHPIRARGFCVDDVWVSLREGEHAYAQPAVDATIFNVTSLRGKRWSASAGNHFLDSHKFDRVLLRHGLRAAFHFIDSGGWNAYAFTYNKREAEVVFSGPMFDGSANDRAFFDRVDFGPSAQPKCKSFWKTFQ